MFIQPWDAALDDAEWQRTADGHDFGILSVNGPPGQAPIAAPTHFTVDADALPGPPRHLEAVTLPPSPLLPERTPFAMATIRLSPTVAAAFPDTLIAVVVATGLRGGEAWPATAAAQEDLEQQLAAGAWAPADESDPRIEAWHTAYRSFGTNPRRIRPSVDALGRRLAKKGSLPRINPAVDSYNAVSVRHGLPAGAFDLGRVTGDVEIRHAEGSETFTPLGEPGTVENPKAGEIIYTDTTDVLTRHWNHRDAHRTRVTEDSAHVAFVLETLHATRDGHLLKTAAGELQDLLDEHSTQSTVHYLGSAHLQVTF